MLAIRILIAIGVIASATWLVAQRDAHAKPVGAPTWATISGPGLPGDVKLFTQDLGVIGPFCGPSGVPLGREQPAVDVAGWRSYQITKFAEFREAEPPQRWVSTETVYINPSGTTGYAKAGPDLLILDQGGGHSGGGSCYGYPGSRSTWGGLSRFEIIAVEKYVTQYRAPTKFATFACAWATSDGVAIVSNRFAPTCR